MKITLGGTEYTIKFGYKAVVESKIIQKLVTLETGSTTELEAVDKILGFLPEFLLVGLQKFHKDEFGFANDDEKKDQLDKVFDLLDDYFATQKEDTKVLKYYLAYDNQKKPYVVVLNDTHLIF